MGSAQPTAAENNVPQQQQDQTLARILETVNSLHASQSAASAATPHSTRAPSDALHAASAEPQTMPIKR